MFFGQLVFWSTGRLEDSVTQLMTNLMPKGIWQKSTDILAENGFAHVKKKQ